VEFSWPVSRVKIEDGHLVGAPRELQARLSEAAAIPGCWMQLATASPREREIRALASLYGFLRAPGERVADWQEMAALLSAIAAPWTDLEPHEKRQELPTPHGIRAAAAFVVSRRLAQDLQRTALARADVALGVGKDGFQPEPRTLAGLFALQALDALVHQPAFRSCAWCHRLFAVGRADQVYCNPRHRWQAANEKKEK
jgi:hypothetical protein